MDTSNPLAPIFAAGVAVQQILEVLSPLVEKLFGESRKKMVLGIVGFIVGLGLASYFGLRVLAYFKVAHGGSWVDMIVTALILSAGTEGTNSIVKFLKYLKEEKKTDAADKVQSLMDRPGNTVSSAAARMRDRLRAAARSEAVSTSAAAAVGTRPDPAKLKAFSYISEK